MKSDKYVALTQEIQTLSSVLLSRNNIMARMGKSFDSQRDIFYSLGYIRNPQIEDYLWRYRRSSLGKRIVQAYPKACWQRSPQVIENDEPGETAFEKAWLELEETFMLRQRFRQLDILSGIGRYGVLFLGFSGSDFTKPLENGEKLLYVRAFSEESATIKEIENNANDPRAGLPKFYQIKTYTDSRDISTTTTVHYSRCIHIVEDAENGSLYGSPRLEASLNDLQSLDYVVGGSGEMFWRGAIPGYGFIAKEGASFPAAGTTAANEVETQLEEFVHNLRRYLKLSDVDVQAFSPSIASPKDSYDVLLSNISAVTEIPKRILVGSERGELASEQDRDNWGDKVAERQENYCTPVILRPFINIMFQQGLLPEPKDYQIKWPPLQAPSGQMTVAVAKGAAEALNTYASGSAEAIVPLTVFLKRYLNFTSAEIDDLETERTRMQGIEDDQIEEETDDNLDEEMNV